MEVRWMMMVQYYGPDPDQRFGGRWSLRGIMENLTTDVTKGPPYFFPEPAFLLVQADVGPKDAKGYHPLDLFIVAPDGETGILNGAIEIEEDAIDVQRFQYAYAFRMDGLPFPQSGRYLFRTELDYHLGAEMPFDIHVSRRN